MGGNGRTIWWSKDAAWWRRERIVALGEEFGADGPAVIDWLSCEAKAQNNGGLVKTGVRSISRGCFVGAETVCHALSRSVTLGLLHDYSDDDGIVTCRISGFREDTDRGNAAARQAKKRSKDADSDDTSHGLSRPVTVGHADSHTGENRTYEEPEGSSSAETRIDVERLCSLLADLIEQNGSKRPTITKAWRDACRRLLDTDGRTEDQVERAIRWAQGDEFWRANVMSMPKLREQYDRLRLQAQRAGATTAPGQSMHPADVRDRELAALGERLRGEAA